MESGNLIFGMVGLVVALVLGYLAGRWTAPEDAAVEAAIAGDATEAAEAGSAAASARRGDMGERGQTRMDRQQLEQHIAHLEGELALQRLRKQILEHELYGEPIPWPDDVPPEHEPGWFRENFRQAVEQCAPDVEIVGFDCSEPPCLVHLRGGEDGWWNRLINECPGWVDHYGSTVSAASGSVDCSGGAEERYQIVGPHSEKPWGDGRDAEENQGKRWDQRVERARFDWECAGAT